MIYEQYQQVLLYLFGIIVLFICGRIFLTPLKTGLRVVVNGGFSIAILALTNFLLSPLGFHLGINVVTVLVCVLLGAPGFATLAILQFMGF